MLNIITITTHINLLRFPLRMLQFCSISLGRERAKNKVSDGFPTSLHAHELCCLLCSSLWVKIHIRFTKLQQN